MTISVMYGVSFLVACICFAFILYIQKQKVESIFTIVSLISLFVHWGYYALSVSENINEALLAYKLTYLDGTIMPYMILLCIMEICGLHRNKTVTRICILPIITYVLSLTAGYSNIYYSNIEFLRIDGFSYLERQHGPLHFLGTICLVIFMLAPIMPVIYAFNHKNTVSYKYTFASGLLIFVNVSAYFIQSILGISFDILPFQYNLIEIFFVYVVYKISRHDIRRQGYMIKNRMKEYGFMAFDGDNRYLGCDDVAFFYFPELEELKVDTTVENKLVEEEFLNWDDCLIDDESIFKYFKRKERDIKCRKKSFVDEDFGMQSGFVVEVINDTENVRHVKELNQMNNELRDAVDEAKRANASKDTFLSRMSHELRTPINAIIGMDEIILRDTRDSRIKPYAKSISSSAKMLLMLINDLLDFSKIESGNMELVEDEYDEKKLLHDAIMMVRQRAINKDLDLVLETVGKIPKNLYGDFLKIQQILINLLTNAVKYTDVGSVKLIVYAEKKKATDDMIYMHYDVVDTGIGIKDEDKGVLFEAFKRVDLKHNSSIEGTGLGLSITSSFVNLLGGTIQIESEFGKGSTFSVVLPQKLMSDETIEKLDINSFNFDEDDDNDKKKLYAPDAKVLVVDDNHTNLSVFKFLLNPTGIQITEADSGEKAIALLEKEQFDIVFLDHMMPVLDGIQTLQRIKEENLIKDLNVAVIALTANAISSAREMYISKGFTDYISKPIDMGKLIEILFTYLPSDKYTFIEADEEEALNSENKFAEEVEKLPALDEFDFEYAIRHLGSHEAVEAIACEIYRSIPTAKEKLESYVISVDHPEVMNSYRIEVHTLKGNAASIGALLLSKTCRLLEVACIEENASKVRLLHPILMEELDKHYARLSVFEQEVNVVDEAKLIDISKEQLIELLENLKEHLADWDYDGAEAVIEKLLGYKIPKDKAAAVEEIIEEVRNVNGAYAIDLIDAML